MAERNKMIKRVALVGAAGLALWLLVGRGRGLGGRRPSQAARTHCKLRLASSGLTVDGKAATIADAAARCRGGTADLAVTGDASYGELMRLRTALQDAGVATTEIVVRLDGAGQVPVGG